MTTLKIDTDIKPPHNYLQKWKITRFIILRFLGYTPSKITITETARGYHTRITIREKLIPEETCYLQWILGDDPHRTMFNWERVKLGVENWNILFTSKELK